MQDKTSTYIIYLPLENREVLNQIFIFHIHNLFILVYLLILIR